MVALSQMQNGNVGLNGKYDIITARKHELPIQIISIPNHIHQIYAAIYHNISNVIEL